jgi:hypothetical protein
MSLSGLSCLVVHETIAGAEHIATGVTPDNATFFDFFFFMMKKETPPMRAIPANTPKTIPKIASLDNDNPPTKT